MQLSPIRRPQEPLSAYRFRYAIFAFQCGIGFAFALAVLVAFHPDASQSALPLLIMFLYFGLPIGLGMSILSSFGFFIGGLLAYLLERNEKARWAWSRIRFLIAALIVIPVSLFCLYLLFLGLTSMETLAFMRHHTYWITPEIAPVFFWVSLILWGAIGFGSPIYLCRLGKEMLDGQN